VTTSGVFTEYPIPHDDSGPYSIASGPDGNMWFTASFVSEVIAITVPSNSA